MVNILVIDDEPKMTALICGQLEDAGLQVTTTTSPREGLDLLAKHSYDIVITDLSMPEVSGMTILEEALKKKSTERPLSAAITCASSSDSIHRTSFSSTGR